MLNLRTNEGGEGMFYVNPKGILSSGVYNNWFVRRCYGPGLDLETGKGSGTTTASNIDYEEGPLFSVTAAVEQYQLSAMEITVRPIVATLNDQGVIWLTYW